MGLLYTFLGEYRKAINLLQKSLNINRAIGDRQGEASPWGNLGFTYYSFGKYPKAIKYNQQVLVMAKAIQNTAMKGHILNNLDDLFVNNNQTEIASVFYKESVNIREVIRSGIRSLSHDLQESYTQTIFDTYRHLADLLLSQGRVLEAQQVLELLKAQEIHDYTRNADAGIRRDIDYLTEELRILTTYASLATFAQNIAECKINNCSQLSQLNQQRDDLQNEFRQKVSELKALIEQRKQKKLLSTPKIFRLLPRQL